MLAAYNVKATFFVTAANPKYYDMIAREVNEGHSVGVHSYSHNYKTIYSSEEAFFNDFNAMEEIIYEQTGNYTQLVPLSRRQLQHGQQFQSGYNVPPDGSAH